jgi:hypothetical protein
MDDNIAKAVVLAERVVGDLVAPAPHERILVIADESGMARHGSLAYALLGAAARRGVEATLSVIPDRAPGSERLTDAIDRSLEGADVMIALTLTTGAPIRTPAASELFLQKRIRFISLMKRSWEHWARPSVVDTDYTQVLATGRALAKQLGTTSAVHMTCANGTDFTVSLEGCHIGVTASFCREPGDLGVLPDGECYTVPVEGTAQGRLVIDGPVTHFGQTDAPVVLEIRDNFVQSVTGSGGVADSLRRVIETVENGGNVCEFAIGTNPQCVADADIQEVKKGAGRVHVAIGSNIGSTVRSPVHIDMVVMRPTVEADGTRIIEAGELVLGSRDPVAV